MQRIKKLHENLIRQVAAGEVVQRPSSILKECIENALDAGATQIDIDIAGGGIDRLCIQDNGCGISKADLPNAIERHATSKIASVEDLEQVLSFGFRGEALASIAAVSRFSIQSKGVDDAHGTRFVYCSKMILLTWHRAHAQMVLLLQWKICSITSQLGVDFCVKSEQSTDI